MYQFVHLESYSRAAPKTAQHKNAKSGKLSSKSGGQCVKYVIDEATRQPDSIPHIDSPAPPILRYGKPLDQLEATCEAWASSMTDSRGHKLRKDALCLAAGVISAPHDITPEAWEKFSADSIEWLKEKYGDALESVLEHTDESHPHLHFYIVPELGQRFETIHQGRAASALVKGQGGKKGEQNQAYKASMREFQDEFFERVGIEHGFTRIGPGKRRLTREEWKLEQIQAAAAAKAITVAQESVQLSKVEATVIKGEAEAIKSEAKEFAKRTLIKADEIIKQAEPKGFKAGFEQGVKDVEKLPWWKKASLFVASVVRERDDLRDKVKTVEAERKTWKEKAAEYLNLGKKVYSELKDIKPKLAAAEDELLVTTYKATQAAQLREENDRLAKRLGDAEHRIYSLNHEVKGLKEQLYPEPEPTPEPARQVRKREHEDALER
jgi:chaperonin cofactor prefoldin